MVTTNENACSSQGGGGRMSRTVQVGTTTDTVRLVLILVGSMVCIWGEEVLVQPTGHCDDLLNQEP